MTADEARVLDQERRAWRSEEAQLDILARKAERRVAEITRRLILAGHLPSGTLPDWTILRPTMAELIQLDAATARERGAGALGVQ